MIGLHLLEDVDAADNSGGDRHFVMRSAALVTAKAAQEARCVFHSDFGFGL